MASDSFESIFQVEDADIDMMGHVNNIVYLRWVQEVAVAHWTAIAPEDDQKNVLWVIARHEIDYKRPALPGDFVRATTRVGTPSGLTFERHTELHRVNDEELLAFARTLWIPINAQTKKPQRLSRALRALFSDEGA